MFAHKLKFILLPQLIATLNNYACSLPPLANVDWSAFPECFCRPCKSTTGEMVPKEGSKLAVMWGPAMAPTVSARLSRPCSGILALCGCMYTSYIATLNYNIVQSSYDEFALAGISRNTILKIQFKKNSLEFALVVESFTEHNNT